MFLICFFFQKINKLIIILFFLTNYHYFSIYLKKMVFDILASTYVFLKKNIKVIYVSFFVHFYPIF